MTKPKPKSRKEIVQTKPVKVGGRRGRPTHFQEEMLREVFIMAKMGAIDTEIAEHIGISISAYYQWRNKNPRFLEALNQGKALWDARVEATLARKAVGYRYTEQQVVKLRDTVGDAVYERIEIVDVEREMPPDTTASIFWLKNRDPNRWRDRHQIDVDQTVTVDAEGEDVRGLAMAVLALLTQANTNPMTIEGNVNDQAPNPEASPDVASQPNTGDGDSQGDGYDFI